MSPCAIGISGKQQGIRFWSGDQQLTLSTPCCACGYQFAGERTAEEVGRTAGTAVGSRSATRELLQGFVGVATVGVSMVEAPAMS